jgi:hypothetical protein
MNSSMTDNLGEFYEQIPIAYTAHLTHIVYVSPIDDDGHPDIASYNKELEQRGNPHWHDVPWLYAECYLCMSNVDSDHID